MRHIKPKDFTGTRAWDALDIETIDTATIRLHWTDKSYIWHINDGPEVFVLLDGSLRMHFRHPDGREDSLLMTPGDIVHCEAGDSHKAEPLTTCRILVAERSGSI
ncbi:MAG: cupin [Alphaproteobacteria bacterium]|nr:cupin [Alphaproteobacteria bacterium]